MSARAFVRLAVVGVLGLGGAACGSNEPEPFTMTVSPEFVQGAIPGASTGVLVTIADEQPTDMPVEISVTATGAIVTVEPSRIVAGQVAEVTIVADAATAERPLDIVVTGTRGDLTSSVTRSTTVLPWEDDRAPYAGQLLDLFTAWLAENEPDLGITPSTAFTGTFVAPSLLVVSHYLYVSDEWELGVAWHIMVAPDDWAEIYVRPRDELAPTHAYRLASQQAAFEDEVVDIAATAPPAEVVR